MFSPAALHAEPASLRALCHDLETLADLSRSVGPWRSGAFGKLADAGLLAGFIPTDCGGTAATELAIVEALAAVAAACLTSALALTQWASACRIMAGGSAELRQQFLPPLAAGRTFTTVGIAQLSTSRRHLGKPALEAIPHASGDWLLEGACPWVTGAAESDTIVTGAVAADGRQLFCIVDTKAPGLAIAPPMHMLALSGSHTSAVTFRGVRPLAVILPEATAGVRTGGLATTALGLGATERSLAILVSEAALRPELAPIAAALRSEAKEIAESLWRAAQQGIDAAPRDALRARANSLVMRAGQAALTAAKGAGFVVGHPAGQAVSEALFFLVWSCPQAVAAAGLCELAGMAPAD